MVYPLRWPMLSLLLSSVAFGQTAEKAAAVVLFDEAEALSERGDFSAACPKYAESHRLDPQLGALLHVADCYERVEQFARAWSGFREAAELAAKRGDARQSVARARAEALEPRVSRLTVVVPIENRADGLTIFLDGVELGRASWELPIPVDGGLHRVTATAPGREPFDMEVRVASEKDRKELVIPTLSRSKNRLAAAPETPVPPRALEHRPSWHVPTIVGAYALGVTAVALGSIFQYKRLQKVDESYAICPSSENCTIQEEHDVRALEADARRAGALSVGSFIVGGGLILGGTALLVFGKPTERGTQKTAALNLGNQGVEFSYAF